MIGMLWYSENSKLPLAERIGQAVSYYQTKYGVQPNICFTNPRTLGETPPVIEGLELRPSRYVLPNHFWIGIRKES